MTVRRLKKMLALSKLSDDSEVAVHTDSNFRDHTVSGCRCEPLRSRYFAGHEPKSKETDCLILDVD